MRYMLAVSVAAASFIALAPAVFAKETVVNIITIDTKGHFDDFLRQHKKARAIYARIDTAHRRLVRDIANPDIVYVIVDYDSRDAMKKAQAARLADPDMKALMREDTNAGWVNVSNTTSIDITPDP